MESRSSDFTPDKYFEQVEKAHATVSREIASPPGPTAFVRNQMDEFKKTREVMHANAPEHLFTLYDQPELRIIRE